jgi:hypothetical protein
MAKTLRVRTKDGWVTKPAPNLPENRLLAEEVDDNFLALETSVESLDARVTTIETTGGGEQGGVTNQQLTNAISAHNIDDDAHIDIQISIDEHINTGNAHGATSSNIADRLVLRNSGGTFGVGEPIIESNPARLIDLNNATSSAVQSARSYTDASLADTVKSGTVLRVYRTFGAPPAAPSGPGHIWFNLGTNV